VARVSSGKRHANVGERADLPRRALALPQDYKAGCGRLFRGSQMLVVMFGLDS